MFESGFSPFGMTSHTSLDLPVKPRVLIADDSRIVRATLIKHIEGMFEFREALDGEQAWETLLLDPSIRVVITDLTMPKLDGYGLLKRIRASKVSRIRDIPVVVVSGSDEREERERVKAAGATDLITKGIGTAQLLSRLDILSKLVGTQREFERSLETLLKDAASGPQIPLLSSDELSEQADKQLAQAAVGKKNFVVLNVRIGIRHVALEGVAALPPSSVVDAIGQLLLRTVRGSDLVAKTGDADFTLVTSGINREAARIFAQRVCSAISNAHLVKDSDMSFGASCGLVAINAVETSVNLPALCDLAARRASLGMNQAVAGVVGQEEQDALERGETAFVRVSAPADTATKIESPDLATLVQWVKEGRREEVLPHIGKLPKELQPLLELLLRQRT
ncbi:response regulator [Noviherbaspirillum sp. ST9]|uniref:response regulator n=1 Tax=Noviherbaspirillum sp. ST9 TaxID=3401606 RepID=UPI003B5892DA